MTTRLTASEERQALALLEEALEKSAEDPTAFIRAAGDADRAVRERTLALLAASDATSASLQTGGAAGLSADADDDGPLPEQIGAFRIDALLGRGGMGAVYQGSRADADFDHQVAIKVVRPGIVSDRLAARFRSERQILAGLRHPNIAQLYDGGETDEGAPYIVMELVDGTSLSRWLRGEEPSLDERLDIFEQICSAVGFAHQNLIVHRDLTPGNVLVTADGNAKLIDFGIARLHETDSPAQPQSGITALSLTPGFAAPERRSGGAVTTLSDIYSLGKIFALMVKPFDEPELQAIADKASADAPEDRYTGAAALAAEVARFRGGFSVPAYSTENAYRTRKYIGRNRLPVALASLAALILVVSLALVTNAYREASIQRDNAEQRFDEVRALSNFLLFDLYDELEDVPGATKALNDIADRARTYLDVLSETEGADRGVRVEAALAYKRLADVLGSPIGANLGRREEADTAMKRAISQLEALHAEAPDDDVVTRGLAEAYFSQAVFAFIALDDNELAHEAGGKSAALYWELAEDGDSAEFGAQAINSEIEAAIPLAWIGRGGEGVTMLKATLGKMEAHIAAHGRTNEHVALLARLLSSLSETIGREADNGDAEFAESLKYADRAIAAYREYLPESPKPDGARRSMATALYKRSLIHYSLEQEERALKDLNEAIGIVDELILLDPEDEGLKRNLSIMREQKAVTLAYAGRGAEGLALIGESTAAKRGALAREPNSPGLMRELASNLLIVGEIAEIAGRKGAACSAYREGRDLFARIDAAGEMSEYDRDVVAAGIPEALSRTC